MEKQDRHKVCPNRGIRMSTFWTHQQSAILEDAVDAARAAKRTALRAAKAFVYAWLDNAIAVAHSTSRTDFDHEMRQEHNLLDVNRAYDLWYALEAPGVLSLLDALRDELDRRRIEFPFPVEIYRSKAEPYSYILTIPNMEA